MKAGVVLLGMALMPGVLLSQENAGASSAIYEQQLENLAVTDETVTEDDAYWQHLEYLRRHPLNINNADEDALKETGLLSALQISSFLHYRRLLGKLISIYELQAIPLWDLATIQNVLPYITTEDRDINISSLKERFRGGEHSWLLRFSEVLEKSKGFHNNGDNHYPGSRAKLFFRYQYKHKTLLQYGVTGDKDAGEQFFGGKQSGGFDFYSFHWFARNMGAVKALAIGDFGVNLGQGLIQWQSLAFSKSASLAMAKRQGPVLKPYTAAGEFNFHRGVGVTIQRKNVEATFFGSSRKLSANVEFDSAGNHTVVTSLVTSGYHRTAAEQQNRHNLRQFTAGGNIRYRVAQGHIGMNAVYYRFGYPFSKPGAPYDLYAVAGNRWSNYSMDYSYTWRNLHAFGEVAAGQSGHAACIHGLLMSLDAKADVAIVYRNISAGYQSFYSNAFTENTMPENENGVYTGISLRPAYGWKLDAYADVYRFPWLKFRVDAPSSGREYLLQLTYTPSRHTEIYSRFRNDAKAINLPGTESVTRPVVQVTRQQWRTQVSMDINRHIRLQSRTELLWYRHATNREQGFLCFGDIWYKPVMKPWAIRVRLQYFETDSYDSRVYAYEPNVLYSYSIPAFYKKGVRYYLYTRYTLKGRRKGSAMCRLEMYFAQFVYPGGTITGSGLDQLTGNTRSEIRLQVLLKI